MTIAVRIRSRASATRRSLLFSMCALACCPAAMPADELPITTAEGLELMGGGSLSLVYRRRGVDFGSYSRIVLEPAQVAFSEEWRQKYRGLGETRRQRLHEQLSARVHALVAADVQGDDGFEIATQDRPDTLRVRVGVADLYVTLQDDTGSTGTISFGEMTTAGTLAIEVRDAVSGLVIARLADRARVDRVVTGKEYAEPWNREDTLTVLRRWSAAFRGDLDRLRKARP